MKDVVRSRLEKCISRRIEAIKNTKEYLFENMPEISREFNVNFPVMFEQLCDDDFAEWIIGNSQKFLSQKHNDLEHIEFIYLIEDLIVSDNNVRIAETIENLAL